jgi:GntR family carbon starvation induced transcriptional regulator
VPVPKKLEAVAHPGKGAAHPARPQTSDLFERLRLDILHCRLRPGSRLLFKDLRKQYGSGLSPLREALMRLVADGLVALEVNKGFRVAPVSREELIDIANTLFELEAIAIRLAIEKGDDRWEGNIVARFHELSKRSMFTSGGTLDEEWQARNVAFHEALYAACGSPLLLLFCRAVSERYSRYRRLWDQQAEPSRNVAREHEQILSAVIARETDAALSLLKKHRSRTTTGILNHWVEPA